METSRRAPAGADPQIAARLGRRQENRDRIEGTGSSWPRVFGNRAAIHDPDIEFDPHTQSMEDFGIRNVEKDVLYNKAENKVPFGPHDAPVFRKAGTVRDVPLATLTTMQSHVSPERVSELVRDPHSGSDPRFRGTPAQELPLVVEQMTRHPETGAWGVTDVLYNGNHRAAAGVARGETTMPARVITRSQRGSATDVFRSDKKRFKGAREQRIDLATTRMALRDASIREGMGPRVWGELQRRDDL